MRSGAVRVPSVIDVDDRDQVLLVVDLVPDAVLAAAGPPQTGEWLSEWGTHHPGIGTKRPVDELPAGKGSGRW